MLEERLFTSVTGAPPPTELEDVLAELEAAKNSDLLRAPDIAFVQQMLAPLHEIDFRHMTEEEEIRVPTHDGVESMFRMRKSKTYHDGGAALMTELEAAIVAHCTEFSVSAAARQDLCNMLANRAVIRHGLPGRMDMEGAQGMVPGFEHVCFNIDEDDIKQFGELKAFLRCPIACMWDILCNPAINLPTDLATEHEYAYDEDSVDGNDPFRGGQCPDICNSLYFLRSSRACGVTEDPTVGSGGLGAWHPIPLQHDIPWRAVRFPNTGYSQTSRISAPQDL